jgi:hypothetical protein
MYDVAKYLDLASSLSIKTITGYDDVAVENGVIASDEELSLRYFRIISCYFLLLKI